MESLSRLSQQHAAWTRYIAVTHVRMGCRWQMPTETHPAEYQMLALVQGQLEAVVDGQRYAAGPGEVMLYSAGMAHSERQTGSAAIEAVFVGFDLVGPAAGLRFAVHSTDPAGRIHYLVHWMLEQVPATTEAQRLALHASLLAILAEHSMPGETHRPDLVTVVREFVRSRLAEPITLDDLAGSAGLSRFYFSRAFRRATGQSPMRFVMQVRLDAAHGMLMTSDAPLKQIARATGFADEFHLSKTFRRVLGRSPSSLRRHEG